METQEELIRRMFVIIDARRWNCLDEIFTSDVQYHRPGYSRIIGIDQLKEFYADIRKISCGRHEIYGLLADSEKGACWGHFSGQNRSNETITEDFAEWYEFNGPAISVRRTFFYEPSI